MNSLDIFLEKQNFNNKAVLQKVYKKVLDRELEIQTNIFEQFDQELKSSIVYQKTQRSNRHEHKKQIKNSPRKIHKIYVSNVQLSNYNCISQKRIQQQQYKTEFQDQKEKQNLKEGMIKFLQNQIFHNKSLVQCLKLNENIQNIDQTIQQSIHRFCILFPLQGGLLTGKYNNGQIPQGSRAGTDNGQLTKEFSYEFFFKKYLEDPESIVQLKKLGDLAVSKGYTQTQLAIAWTLYNKNVSTAIIGAKNAQQVKESVKALELYKKWDQDLEQKVEAIIQNKPKQDYNWQTGKPLPDRR